MWLGTTTGRSYSSSKSETITRVEELRHLASNSSEDLVKLIPLLVFALPTLLRADGLTDVRLALQKLQSDQPLRARVEIKTRPQP